MRVLLEWLEIGPDVRLCKLVQRGKVMLVETCLEHLRIRLKIDALSGTTQILDVS